MTKINKKKLVRLALDFLMNVSGTALLALGIHVFTAPCNIAPGGVSGLATIINYVSDWPIGLVSLFLNMPLFVLGWLGVGKKYTLKSLVSVVTFALFIDIVFAKVPEYTNNYLLAAIFGGVLTGTGMAMVFLTDASTGGTDILGKFIQVRLPHIPLGRLLLCIDAVIVLVSMIIFHSLEASLYAIITIFVSSRLIDAVIYGFDEGKLAYIISGKNEEIAEYILTEMNRGATFLDGEGAYSKAEKKVLLCVIRRNEFTKLRRYIRSADPRAFVAVTNAAEVFGEGFKNIHKE
jgi:uncharacterized membrane-anchored protein YitT (DUF2179 family)